MPQAIQTGEFNTFVGGLVTEASPLTFPENASLDEDNFILNRDGSRRRRLGMDREQGLTPYSLTYSISPVGDLAVSTHEWKGVAGVAGKTFIVCQVHDKVYVIDRADSTLKSSSYVKAEIALLPTQSQRKAGFASIDGKLVIAYGNSTIKVVTYDAETDNFTAPDQSIKIRDLFGVAATFDGKDLLSPEYINLRVESADPEDEHTYNLRNQGWAVPSLEWIDTTAGYPVKVDNIAQFYSQSSGKLPSNADSPTPYIYAGTHNADKNSLRFNYEGSVRSEPVSERAPRGHFVIDLLDRGASRKEQYELVTNPTTGKYANVNPGGSPTHPSFRTTTVTLTTDRTLGGVNLVEEFAGRVWYGGFSDELEGGDSQSPALSSYIFYSQQVEHSAQISRCYQDGDPTSADTPDRLDTDGGFIRLSGANNIQAMVNVGSGLMVLAENGVWLVGGSDSGAFNANNQSVTKVTEQGTTSPNSIVVVDNSVMYWSDDAIYYIGQDQFGSYKEQEMTTNIRSFYQDISDSSKVNCQGSYDSYEKKVRWVYDNTAETEKTRELVFDIELAAFSTLSIGNPDVSQVPVAPIQVSPYNLDTVEVDVLVGADSVLSGTDDVVVDQDLIVGGFRETAYLTLVNSEDTNNTSLTFSTYNNSSFKDWESVDGIGVDAKAYLLTGYIGTGDNHRFKQVPYIYFHFLRTESGFTDSGDDFIVTNESSCKVRSQWDWTNSAAAGKWGKEFQAYRYRRMYMPDSLADEYDNGHRTIVSKNKLRGRGRVVSLLISSEEGKDMQLLGWSMMIGSNQNV